MPHDLNPDWMHVYDWLDIPASDEEESAAKAWLEEYTKPVNHRNRAFLDSQVVTCEYEGQRYRVTGASRLGDLWLNTNHDADHGYTIRVDVQQCSGWSVKKGA